MWLCLYRTAHELMWTNCCLSQGRAQMKRQTFKFGSIAAAAAVLAVAAGTTYSVVHHSVPLHVAVANTLRTRLGHSESTNSSAQVAHAANSNTDNTVSRNSIDNSTATPLNAMHNSNLHTLSTLNSIHPMRPRLHSLERCCPTTSRTVSKFKDWGGIAVLNLGG